MKHDPYPNPQDINCFFAEAIIFLDLEVDCWFRDLTDNEYFKRVEPWDPYHNVSQAFDILNAFNVFYSIDGHRRTGVVVSIYDNNVEYSVESANVSQAICLALYDAMKVKLK